MSPLPDNQTRGRFIAVARDPSTLFAYWELSSSATDALKTRIGEAALDAAQWVIRLTNLETAATSDVPIEPDARNWYIAVLPGVSYEVELGVITEDAQFLRVFATQPVRMPNASYSHHYDRQWMILEEDYLKLLSLGFAGFLGSSSGLHLPAGEDEEAAFVTVIPNPAPGEGGSATSPGVPKYTGRR